MMYKEQVSISAGNLLFNAALYLRHFSNTYIYYRSHGRLPNYVEPHSFNEKVQWRKLFDRNPLFPCFVDKLAVRDYVSRRAPTIKFARFLWTGSDPDEIPYADLPERFVLKPSHRSGDVLFIRSQSELDRGRIATTCRRWLSLPYGRSRREWAFQSLNRQLIIEEMLQTDPDPLRSRDYRCYVFDGALAAIMVTAGRVNDLAHHFSGEGLVFDRAWNRLPYHKYFDRLPDRADSARPEVLDQMIAAAESLGRGVDCVRVDFLVVDTDVYFSELTIYPGSGMNKIDIDLEIGSPATDPFEIFLGSKWALPAITLREQLSRGLLNS